MHPAGLHGDSDTIGRKGRRMFRGKTAEQDVFPAGQKIITIMAVDDHAIFIDGISSMIRDEPGFSLVATADNGVCALRRFREFLPDVTLMDLEMPGLDGLAAAQSILREFPAARIVMLSMHTDVAFIRRAMRAGAYAYVAKRCLVAELVTIVRQVHAGVRCFEPARTGAEDLTARELAVLRLVAEGRSNRQAGQALRLSEETVKKYLKNLRAKLGARDRAHAVAIAAGRGILVLPLRDGGESTTATAAIRRPFCDDV
jgi:DNA-binding NarL/FixJ family response regulator